MATMNFTLTANGTTAIRARKLMKDLKNSNQRFSSYLRNEIMYRAIYEDFVDTFAEDTNEVFMLCLNALTSVEFKNTLVEQLEGEDIDGIPTNLIEYHFAELARHMGAEVEYYDEQRDAIYQEVPQPKKPEPSLNEMIDAAVDKIVERCPEIKAIDIVAKMANYRKIKDRLPTSKIKTIIVYTLTRITHDLQNRCGVAMDGSIMYDVAEIFNLRREFVEDVEADDYSAAIVRGWPDLKATHMFTMNTIGSSQLAHEFIAAGMNSRIKRESTEWKKLYEQEITEFRSR